MSESPELAYLNSLEFFGIRLGLEQIQELLDRIGNPERKLRFIHVAGSNGKGSVCAFLEQAFRSQGWKTGFYSSPHLVSVCERFQINGIPVPEDRLFDVIRRIRPAADAMAAEGHKVTYFEFVTAAAALIFAEAGTDIVVWEVGMGGRLDATNVITPLASVITGISLEHKQYLGDTEAAIAGEKAGIIKQGVPVFTSRVLGKEALSVIKETAERRSASFYFAEELMPDEEPLIRLSRDQKNFSQSFHFTDGTALTIPLPGPHQRRNAALAASVLRILAPQLELDYASCLRSFAQTRWDARFQFIPERGLVIDAGHNPEGIGVLAETLEEVFPGKKFHFLFGAFSDKDTVPSLKRLVPLAEKFTFLHMDTMRASRETEELGSQLESFAPDVSWDAMPLEDALFLPEDNKILCGSLHLCGDALAILKM